MPQRRICRRFKLANLSLKSLFPQQLKHDLSIGFRSARSSAIRGNVGPRESGHCWHHTMGVSRILAAFMRISMFLKRFSLSCMSWASLPWTSTTTKQQFCTSSIPLLSRLQYYKNGRLEIHYSEAISTRVSSEFAFSSAGMTFFTVVFSFDVKTGFGIENVSLSSTANIV